MTAAAWDGVKFVAAFAAVAVLAAAAALLWVHRHPHGLVSRLSETGGLPTVDEEWT